MIELMLQAERNLAMGLTEQAEQLYRKAIDSDPRNAIAVVGLARVALARDDEQGAYSFAVEALRIDPENAAALRLENRLSEVFAERGEAAEREAFAIQAAADAARRADAELAELAREAPTPAPGRPDYAPTPGTRYAEVVRETNGESGAAAESGSPAQDAAAADATSAAPSARATEDGAAPGDESRLPGLLRRLLGR